MDTSSKPSCEQKAKLEALRRTLDAVIANGDSYTADEVDAAVDEALDAWEAERSAPKPIG